MRASRIPRAVANGLLALASLVMALVLCEAGARIILNPGDYLSAPTVPDEVLGIRVAAGAAGFDRWGFRNRGVPPTADIVAIGDSHTYGNNAPTSDSWPAVVARLTGKSTYNLALGGYGPNQYSELLRQYALTLKPHWVLCGLYLGDDFENAYLITYGLDHWRALRNGSPVEGVNPRIWQDAEGGTWHGDVRIWLSQHSLLYRLLVHGPLFGELKGALQIRKASRGHDGATTSLLVSNAGIQEAFRPLALRSRLDQDSPAVREGMRITLHLLAQMNEMCRAHGCRLAVVLIPTKETVFADYVLARPGMPLSRAIAELVDHEREARRRVVAFLVEEGIPYVDTLPALRRRVGDQLYTRSDRDMHPNRNGYRVIGEAVAAFLDGQDQERRR